jgi:hypothetical protein
VIPSVRSFIADKGHAVQLHELVGGVLAEQPVDDVVMAGPPRAREQRQLSVEW